MSYTELENVYHAYTEILSQLTYLQDKTRAFLGCEVFYQGRVWMIKDIDLSCLGTDRPGVTLYDKETKQQQAISLNALLDVLRNSGDRIKFQKTVDFGFSAQLDPNRDTYTQLKAAIETFIENLGYEPKVILLGEKVMRGLVNQVYGEPSKFLCKVFKHAQGKELLEFINMNGVPVYKAAWIDEWEVRLLSQ